MPKVVGIKFKQSGKIYDFSPNGLDLKVGDKVVYSRYAGTDVKIEDEEFIIVKQDDILAILAD